MKSFLKFLIRIPLVIILAPIIFCFIAAAWILISLAMAIGGVYILYEFLIYGDSITHTEVTFTKKENENENKDSFDSGSAINDNDKL